MKSDTRNIIVRHTANPPDKAEALELLMRTIDMVRNSGNSPKIRRKDHDKKTA